ncbi:permease [Tissierella praeacuta]|uniref:permease n=1 Tax=Tissierella praeacuta TaxID=43131 RepID=UPI001C10317D|nr:permease [Tissierella praeacuta]MBU5255940.1 permease [Tissierella praeacuta]
MMQRIKKNLFLFGVILIYIVLFVINTEKAMLSISNTGYYLKEMLMIMPVVFLLTALIEAWIPKNMIMNVLGEKSGLKGSFISLALGSISAGPIYAAFPVCKTLLKKGASVSNIVVILSSWAVIKIPMLANEAKFLSLKFMMIRWIFTTIAIIAMGYIIGKIVKKEDIPHEAETLEKGEIAINNKTCIGCGVCAKEAPEYFKIKNKKAILITDNINGKDGDKAKVAMEKCPVNAIEIGEEIDKQVIKENVKFNQSNEARN